MEVSGLLSNQRFGHNLTQLVHKATRDRAEGVPAPERRLRRRPIRLAQSEIAVLVAEYQRRRVSLDELASEFGIHRQTAARHLDSAGITQRRKTITTSQVRAAIGLYEDGWSLARIGRHFDVAPSSVNYRLRKAGVRLRPRRGREQE